MALAGSTAWRQPPHGRGVSCGLQTIGAEFRLVRYSSPMPNNHLDLILPFSSVRPFSSIALLPLSLPASAEPAISSAIAPESYSFDDDVVGERPPRLIVLLSASWLASSSKIELLRQSVGQVAFDIDEPGLMLAPDGCGSACGILLFVFGRRMATRCSGKSV